MKKSGWRAGLALLLAGLGCASAQVSVEVTQEQQQFLSGESLKVAVRITNLSGQDLQLGADEDWLRFAVESRDGIVVPKLGEALVAGAFVLPSSKVAIKRVDLAPYFALSQSGSYQIVATVRVKGWSRELTSPPKTFDLIQGAKLWEQEVGVPTASGTNHPEPEVRRYVLQQANYIRGQIRLYLRVTDAYNKPIKVFAVGPMVSFGRPEHQVDYLSNLHLLYQDGASSFNYTVCDLNGEVTLRQTYDYVDSRPRLRTGDDGNITVMGGTRRITANDVPASKPDDSASEPGQAGPTISATNPAPVPLSTSKP